MAIEKLKQEFDRIISGESPGPEEISQIKSLISKAAVEGSLDEIRATKSKLQKLLKKLKQSGADEAVVKLVEKAVNLATRNEGKVQSKLYELLDLHHEELKKKSDEYIEALWRQIQESIDADKLATLAINQKALEEALKLQKELEELSKRIYELDSQIQRLVEENVKIRDQISSLYARIEKVEQEILDSGFIEDLHERNPNISVDTLRDSYDKCRYKNNPNIKTEKQFIDEFSRLSGLSKEDIIDVHTKFKLSAKYKTIEVDISKAEELEILYKRNEEDIAAKTELRDQLKDEFVAKQEFQTDLFPVASEQTGKTIDEIRAQVGVVAPPPDPDKGPDPTPANPSNLDEDDEFYEADHVPQSPNDTPARREELQEWQKELKEELTILDKKQSLEKEKAELEESINANQERLKESKSELDEFQDADRYDDIQSEIVRLEEENEVHNGRLVEIDSKMEEDLDDDEFDKLSAESDELPNKIKANNKAISKLKRDLSLNQETTDTEQPIPATTNLEELKSNLSNDQTRLAEINEELHDLEHPGAAVGAPTVTLENKLTAGVESPGENQENIDPNAPKGALEKPTRDQPPTKSIVSIRRSATNLKEAFGDDYQEQAEGFLTEYRAASKKIPTSLARAMEGFIPIPRGIDYSDKESIRVAAQSKLAELLKVANDEEAIKQELIKRGALEQEATTTKEALENFLMLRFMFAQKEIDLANFSAEAANAELSNRDKLYNGVTPLDEELDAVMQKIRAGQKLGDDDLKLLDEGKVDGIDNLYVFKNQDGNLAVVFTKFDDAVAANTLDTLQDYDEITWYGVIKKADIMKADLASTLQGKPSYFEKTDGTIEPGPYSKFMGDDPNDYATFLGNLHAFNNSNKPPPSLFKRNAHPSVKKWVKAFAKSSSSSPKQLEAFWENITASGNKELIDEVYSSLDKETQTMLRGSVGYDQHSIGQLWDNVAETDNKKSIADLYGNLDDEQRNKLRESIGNDPKQIEKFYQAIKKTGDYRLLGIAYEHLTESQRNILSKSIGDKPQDVDDYFQAMVKANNSKAIAEAYNSFSESQKKTLQAFIEDKPDQIKSFWQTIANTKNESAIEATYKNLDIDQKVKILTSTSLEIERLNSEKDEIEKRDPKKKNKAVQAVLANHVLLISNLQTSKEALEDQNTKAGIPFDLGKSVYTPGEKGGASVVIDINALQKEAQAEAKKTTSKEQSQDITQEPTQDSGAEPMTQQKGKAALLDQTRSKPNDDDDNKSANVPDALGM